MSALSHPSPAPVKQPPVLEPTPVAAPPSGGGRWKWLILLAIVGVAAFFGYRQATKPAAPASVVTVKTAKVTLGNLERTARVSGQSTAISFANITAPMLRGPDANREMILLQIAAPGSWVKKGTLIAKIDAQSMQDHVDDLGDTIQAAQADISKRRAEQMIELETMEQNVRITKTEFDKAGLDFGLSELRTDIERQLLKLSLDETEARYKQAVADIDLKKAANEADIKILEYTLLRHTRHRDRHVRDVEAFSIYASMDGLVVMSPIFRGSEMGQVQQGDRLFPGQSFMKVVNTASMQLEGSVNQAESSEFRLGQKASIKLDAFPGVEFSGKVYNLGALAAASQRQSPFIRNVPIRISIEGSDPRLIPDLSASADVVLERAENKLLIPLSAVGVEGDKPVVYVKSGDKFVPREVSLGLQSGTHAVALAGLEAGDEVRLN